MQLIQVCTKTCRAGGTGLGGWEQSPTVPPLHSHKGQLLIVGFDAADVVRRSAAQRLHQPVQGGSELQSTTGRWSGPAGGPGGYPGTELGASPSCTWLEMDFLLLWLPGRDLRLGRPGSRGPLDLRDCRDTSPSSRKSSASRADCTEQSCEQQAAPHTAPEPAPAGHSPRGQPCAGSRHGHSPSVPQMCRDRLCPLREPKGKSWAPSQVNKSSPPRCPLPSARATWSRGRRRQR